MMIAKEFTFYGVNQFLVKLEIMDFNEEKEPSFGIIRNIMCRYFSKGINAQNMEFFCKFVKSQFEARTVKIIVKNEEVKYECTA